MKIAEIIRYFTDGGELWVEVRLVGAKGTIIIRASEIDDDKDKPNE